MCHSPSWGAPPGSCSPFLAVDYHTFVDDTAARGYNAIEFHVVNHDPRGNRPPFNGNGDPPFLKRLNGTAWNGSLSYGNVTSDAPDLTTPNEIVLGLRG